MTNFMLISFSTALFIDHSYGVSICDFYLSRNFGKWGENNGHDTATIQPLYGHDAAISGLIVEIRALSWPLLFSLFPEAVTFALIASLLLLGRSLPQFTFLDDREGYNSIMSVN